MPELAVAHQLSKVARNIIRTVLYYDIFDYPLKEEELFQNVSEEMDLLEFRGELNELIAQGLLGESDGFISNFRGEDLIERRIAGNQRAQNMLKRAHRISQFIGQFPFVRAVCLSGSISKNYMDEGTDIDYFVITKPGRLWLARTLLVGFKKVFLFNSYKYFCMNYFIDTDHLEIEEQNIFTATEIATLIPTYGRETYIPFVTGNNWAKAHYPNFNGTPAGDIPVGRAGALKKFLEWTLSFGWGDALDRYFMGLTMRQWEKKFGHFQREDFDVAMKSRKYVSKHHPGNFQQRVLSKLAEKRAQFEHKHGITV